MMGQPNPIAASNACIEVNFGHGSLVSNQAKIAPTAKVGRYTIIEADVQIGENVTIGDFVKLCSGTKIGRNSRIDDYVTTSGYCEIGSNVTIKRCTMIGQACRIHDDVWIGSHVTTTRVKYPGTIYEKPHDEEWVTIEERAVIGSSSLLMAGVTVGHDAVIGSGSTVAADCVPFGVYTGEKAKLRRIRKGATERNQNDSRNNQGEHSCH